MSTRNLVIGGIVLAGLWWFGVLGRIHPSLAPPAATPPANPIPQTPIATGAPMGGCPPQLSGSQCLSYLEQQEATKREAGWQGVAGNLGGSLLKGLGVS
jgi:hypothetical protein